MGFDFYDYYGSDGFYSEIPDTVISPTFLGGIALVIILAVIIALALSIVKYVFLSIALYNIGKNRGMKHPFFAFIPYLNQYYIGEIADDVTRTMNKKTRYALRIIIFLIAMNASQYLYSLVSSLSEILVYSVGVTVATLIFNCLTVAVILVVMVLYLVHFYKALYVIYREYYFDKAVLYLILSILVPCAYEILLFKIRNKKSGYQLWCEERAAEPRFVRFEEEEAESTVEETFTDIPTDDIDSDQTVIE